MSANRNYTTGEVVEMTIRTLENISVPVGLIGQIGTPIVQAVNNLKKVQEAWAKEAEALQAAMEQAKEEEPEEPEQEETGEVNQDQWEESE